MKTYWRASRPYSFTAALVPVFLGTGLAKLLHPEITLNWINFFLVLVGCVAVQAISNLVNDLVDFKTGVDSKATVGRYNALVEGSLTWTQMFRAVLVLCVFCAAIGGYFAWLVPGPVAGIVIVGGVLAIGYTAPPLKLKYRAMGDLGVLLAFGLGMVYGTYFVMAKDAGPRAMNPGDLLLVLVYSLPSSSLVVAILHANNHRDRETDRHGGGKTLANSLPFGTSKNLLVFLLVAPYVFAGVASVVGVLQFGWISLLGLAVFLSIPPLRKLLPPIQADRYERTVPMVAKLHGQFGLLLAVAILGQILISHGRIPGHG